MFNDCIIMAGGFGVRLWPASSTRRPKQFLSISGEGKSFFTASVERALALITGDDGRVIIIAGKSHVPHIVEACACFNANEKKRLVLIPEPTAKNTAPAIACAVMYADWVSGQERNMMVLTSDHIIQPLATFKVDAVAAAAFAQQDKLAVFGIAPTKPETQYGYIETAKRLSEPHGTGAKSHRLTEPDVLVVASFHEKPDRKTAEKFISSKRFYWNSGMFAFNSKFIIKEYCRLSPDVILPFQKLSAPGEKSYSKEKGLRILKEWAGLEEAYRLTRSISFDYAIAEKCSQVVMVSAGFDWIDVGNWDEYSRLLGDTKSETYYAGNGKNSSCFVDSDIPVALAGVDDLIVAIRSGKDGRPPVALITKKGETHYVREIVEQIRKAGKHDLL
jgi:mannose-1-phosphate guanylyltransferase/mannose-1-phosphate guanylyltransferase/mannose-6-phosphate isomerase